MFSAILLFDWVFATAAQLNVFVKNLFNVSHQDKVLRPVVHNPQVADQYQSMAC